jgi:ribosome-binding ATPase YchF (GTP1/OBG family)
VKDVGLVGVPYAGKSTLFTALTRTGASGGRANQAVVPVPDARLPILAEFERSKRIVPAQVRFVDVPGGTTAQGLATLRTTDALCVVLRSFGPDANPTAELAEVRTDLLLADLAVLDSALENARRRLKGRGAQADEEVMALERAHALLSSETPLREAGLEEGQVRFLRGLAPLTLKPWVLVANLEEGKVAPPGLPEGIVGVYAEVEAETAAMSPEEARELLAEFGVKEPGLDRVVAACYQALDLITFLTTGEDESRAWEVRRGARAPEAAGVIHSDMERGFIRAEVVSYEDLVAAGGWDAAKHKGLLRVEGRDYVVREGDVLHVRFAV